jgi:2'-5' RNA ligase
VTLITNRHTKDFQTDHGQSTPAQYILGRFKRGFHAAMPKLQDRAASLVKRHFGDWKALEVEIVRSELTSAGTIYAELASFPLAR